MFSTFTTTHMWQIFIDTGGTFTDCIAITPEGSTKRLKILSSSRLKGKIINKIDDFKYQAEMHWQINDDIFKNYKLSQIGNQDDHLIDSIDFEKNIITFQKSTNIKPGDFTLTSGEEVPILASRILTSTRLDQDLPSIDMRLGSTKGTNALLERKGADVIFLTTKGFKDLITIGSQQRPHIFSLNIQKPKPLYKDVVEIDERLDKDGLVVTELTQDHLYRLTNSLKSIDKSTSFAIAFMNSYQNNVHENRLKELLLSQGFSNITCSSAISNNIKILSRAETAVANAYLQPVIESYLNGILDKLGESHLRIMTSAGAIVNASHFTPKDSLLSGPAGGIVGAKTIAELSGYNQIITFDMGGTSTDVAIYNDGYDYQYETKVGDATILSPGLSIETIAAGGGSICNIKDNIMQVGPESAGSTPGPSCYGENGPLSITDINLLSGRIVESNFSIPLDKEKARLTLENMVELNDENLLAFLNIANEKMAEAIKKVSVKKGYSPSEYALVTYGGAGGQHACAIAELLKIKIIIVPYDAGLLSAYGIGKADIEQFAEKQILEEYQHGNTSVEAIWQELEDNARHTLLDQGFVEEKIFIKKKLLYLRYKGQEATVELEITPGLNIQDAFYSKYESVYAHKLEHRTIEIESVKLIAAVSPDLFKTEPQNISKYTPTKDGSQSCLTSTGRTDVNFYKWEKLQSGANITGPAIVVSNNCTLFIENNWSFNIDQHNHAILIKSGESQLKNREQPEMANIELFKNRFASIVEKMGTQLQRTSFSVNIKERLDFSCTLLDKDGFLIVNAPHIPVHLGSMGICVRKVIAEVNLGPGDIIITNHPAYGGSHLPDITLITGVFIDDELIGYLANRAHHAEIGGKTPGSMPTDATSLEEEGVIIKPQHLSKRGEFQWEDIKKVFLNAKHPTRSIQENMADLEGAVASLQKGIQELESLCTQFGTTTVDSYMQKLKSHVDKKLWQKLSDKEGRTYSAFEELDDGSTIQVKISFAKNNATFDFTGTSSTHPNNLNATEAIVNSVVLYVLRLLLDEELPLNEGLMEHVNIILPYCLLNPNFKEEFPAVVGGNTEVSQRLTDTLLKALGMAACSQGTMNNVLFGNDHFGYYETICGGVGAGEGFDGADAVHQHMTNTKITDPEIMEMRYPVRLNKWEIRKGSGGTGKWKGGDGIIREISFLESLKLTLLTQHRVKAPYGLEGGKSGALGIQTICKPGYNPYQLDSCASLEVEQDDIFTIYTPGGGGFGNSTD